MRVVFPMLLNRQFLHNGTKTRTLNEINIMRMYTYIHPLVQFWNVNHGDKNYGLLIWEYGSIQRLKSHTDRKQKPNTGSTKALRRRRIYTYTYCVEVLYCQEAVILSYLSAAEAHKMPVQPAPRLWCSEEPACGLSGYPRSVDQAVG